MPPHSQNHSFLHSAEYTDIANARLHTKWCWVNANWLRRTQKYSENRHRIVWCCLHGFRTILETFSSFACNFDFGHKTTDFVTAAISTGRRGRVCVCGDLLYGYEWEWHAGLATASFHRVAPGRRKTANTLSYNQTTHHLNNANCTLEWAINIIFEIKRQSTNIQRHGRCSLTLHMSVQMLRHDISITINNSN